MPQEGQCSPLSALEDGIIATLHRRPEGRGTVAELAQHMHVPDGTVKYGLQWLMSYRVVQYDGEHYQLRPEAEAA